jgi:hypothetical protein
MSTDASRLSLSPSFTKDTLIRGQPAKLSCIEIGGQVYSVSRSPLRIMQLEDEWYEDIKNPRAVVDALQKAKGPKPDLLTFWQRVPDIAHQHPYHVEWEDLAVLPISSFENWWKVQIKSRVRNQIRKSEREGVVVKEVPYDDEFVRGMTAIFNETPVRQGRKFWHYGKDFFTIKTQFSRYLFRERMIGAYYQGEMIGFMMLGIAGRFALTGQIISSVKHRDKLPNNALMAKAVDVCVSQGLAYLVYLFWTDDSLSEFKRRCGFERVRVPRYYVPLNWKGSLALKVGVHRSWKALIPANVRTTLKRARTSWYEMFGKD